MHDIALCIALQCIALKEVGGHNGRVQTLDLHIFGFYTCLVDFLLGQFSFH